MDAHSPPKPNLRAELHNDYWVVSIAGPFTFISYPEIEPLLEQDMQGVAGVVFDLRAATAIDSAAIGLMMVAQQRIGWGRRLEVICIPGVVNEMIVRMNLDRVFSVRLLGGRSCSES